MAKIMHLEECAPFLLVSSSPSVRCCDVRLTAAFLFFPSVPPLLADAFLLSQVLAWTLLVRRVGFLNELRLSREHQRESTVCGLIPDVVVPLCFFKIVLSTLEKQLMVIEDL
jgi:hypothetical protein